jgi:hypothetical protein
MHLRNISKFVMRLRGKKQTNTVSTDNFYTRTCFINCTIHLYSPPSSSSPSLPFPPILFYSILFPYIPFPPLQQCMWCVWYMYSIISLSPNLHSPGIWGSWGRGLDSRIRSTRFGPFHIGKKGTEYQRLSDGFSSLCRPLILDNFGQN